MLGNIKISPQTREIGIRSLDSRVDR